MRSTGLSSHFIHPVSSENETSCLRWSPDFSSGVVTRSIFAVLSSVSQQVCEDIQLPLRITLGNPPTCPPAPLFFIDLALKMSLSWSCHFSFIVCMCVLHVFSGFCNIFCPFPSVLFFLVPLTRLIFPPHLSHIRLIIPALFPEFLLGLFSLHTCNASPSLALPCTSSPR